MRTECFYNNELIHIADYFTTINGMQIAIEDEIEKLRVYGRNGQLICGCGCGGKLTLVAGKSMKRRQHFRLKEGQKIECKAHKESAVTINAKVVLKCWLDDVLGLQSGDVIFNKSVNMISDLDRKYEYTHWVPSRQIGICYEKYESNLNDEKIQLLASQDSVTSLYITDIANDGCQGQYPEFGIKVQKAQGYYALLSAGEMTPYQEAVLKIVRYEKLDTGIWNQIDVCEEKLSQYYFDEQKKLCLRGESIYKCALESSNKYYEDLQAKQRKIEEEKETKETELLEAQMRETKAIEEKKKEINTRLECIGANEITIEEARKKEIENALIQ